MEVKKLVKFAKLYKIAAFLTAKDVPRLMAVVDELLDPRDAAEFKTAYYDSISDEYSENNIQEVEDIADRILNEYSDRDLDPDFIPRLSDAIDKLMEISQEHSIEESFNKDIEQAKENAYKFQEGSEIAKSDGASVTEDIYKKRERQRASAALKRTQFKEKVKEINKKYDASRVHSEKRKKQNAFNNRLHRYFNSELKKDPSLTLDIVKKRVHDKAIQILEQKVQTLKDLGESRENIELALGDIRLSAMSEALEFLIEEKDSQKEIQSLTNSQKVIKSRIVKKIREINPDIEIPQARNTEELENLKLFLQNLKMSA